MNHCKNCGVDLDENMNVCPLCGISVSSEFDGTEPGTNKKKNDETLYSDYESLTQEQRRKLFWELSGIILISGMITTLIIDLIISKSITWSKYSVTVCLVLLINATLFSLWRRRFLLVVAGSFISTSILLILLDVYSLNIGWGIRLGIPFLFSFYLITLILIFLIKISRQLGFNILAYFFMAIGLFAMCIEGIISMYFKNTFYLHWSIIVIASMFPISAILLFIHYRLKKGIDLKRFFNI